MKSQRIISREYKLVLKAKEFVGEESVLLEKSTLFWTSLNSVPELKCSGSLSEPGLRREIRFYDTDDSVLYHHNYIFRERKGEEDEKKEITLKFRHPDRYVSGDRDMLPKKIGKGSRKFEEDIKRKFQSLYSYSSSQSCKEEQAFERLGDISKYYPGIEKDIHHFDKDEKLHIVNSLQIRELVIKGGEILLCESPGEKAECALIAWYDLGNRGNEPLIVEFSFRYGNKKENYDREVSQNAYDLFLNIQEKLDPWLDKDANTKTGFLYAG